MAGLFHRDADLLGPRVPGEGAAEDLFELGPMPVRRDRIMDADHAAASGEELDEALAEGRLDLFGG